MRSPGRPPGWRREHRQASGMQSRPVPEVKTRPRRSGCHPRLGPGGSVRVAECERSAVFRCRTTLSPSPSGRRSPSSRHRARSPRDRPPLAALAVDGVAGAASERGDPWREARVSSDDGAVACGPACLPAQDREPRRERQTAQLLAGPVGRRDRSTEREAGARTHSALDRPATPADARTGGGPSRGARSRFRTVSRSTSPMMRRCGSAERSLGEEPREIRQVERVRPHHGR
jgi:hypothetical protein